MRACGAEISLRTGRRVPINLVERGCAAPVPARRENNSVGGSSPPVLDCGLAFSPEPGAERAR